ncbi:DEKNAAC102498 [Brettanomyces naardenensis]|uniref:Importin-95 n=1 Tax=Brettanomyces naardenensis TaxID=13370 RepID=A0A448YK28_BRENA|nr:DEKNAAC102498 [Brettanomyces naardenensis]
MEISQVLENAILNPSTEARRAAEGRLSDLAAEDWVSYLGQMVQVLGDENQKTEVRMLAGLGVKNQLTSKDTVKKQQQAERWVQIDASTKQQIKDVALNTLLTPSDRVANQAAQLVAAIADIELPRDEWPQLMHVIVDNTKTDRPVNVKRASLLTIGYICETADPENPHVAAQSNGILIAIVQGAQSSEPSLVVRRTAISALVNSLEFIAGNFEREGERNYIMQVVCEATTADDPELQALAFGALAKIMNLYYQYMGVYMEKALYGLTVAGMRSTDDRVACMAVEFWSTVCEEELEIQLRREELVDPAQSSDLVSYNFALVAISDVLPTLLGLLTRQNEDEDDDSWSVAMAAGACLQLFAQNTGNYVVRPTLQFVEQNLVGPGWRQKEAAVMAFGSILDGPDRSELRTVITQALPPILALIKDESVPVRETVSWCIGRIADLVVDAIDVNTMLPQLLEAVVYGLGNSPKVITNCCWTLINLLEQFCHDAPEQPTSVMSQYYHILVPVLLQISGRDDNQDAARTSAFEALSSAVLYSSQGDIQYVSQIATEAMARLSQTMQAATQPGANIGEHKAELQELQSNILSLLTNVTRRIGPEASTVADQLMETYLRLLGMQEPDSVIEEDIFMAISAVASAVDAGFVKYMPAFLPFLTKALESVDSPVCDAAIGLVVDICHSLGENFIPYCQGFMAILGNALSNPQIRRELRPLILSCFGDIASSIGKEFIQYLDVVMNICNSAQNLQADDQSYEYDDYLINVKESVLDAYVGVVAGLHDFPDSLFPYLGQVAQFLMSTYTEPQLASNESVARSSVGMIGDLAQMYPDGRWKQFFAQNWVTDYIKKTRSNQHFSQVTRDTARWAREQQKLQLQN